jgi:integrase
VALRDLRPLDLQDLYSSLLGEGHLSSGTVLNLHLALTRALSQGVRWGLLGANPARGAQPPRPARKEPVVVDERLASRILSLTRETSFELPVAIALATGMRRGEIMGLRWADLDHGLTTAQVRRSLQPTRGGLVIQEPKTRRSRRLGELAGGLQGLPPLPPPFPRRDGRRVSPRGSYALVVRLSATRCRGSVVTCVRRRPRTHRRGPRGASVPRSGSG